MTASQATILNSIILIAAGGWGYLSEPSNRSEELIPLVFGLLFLIAIPPLRKDNRIVEFILRSLGLLLSIALVLALVRAIQESQVERIIRIVVMLAATAFTFFVLISKMNARLKERRKNRE